VGYNELSAGQAVQVSAAEKIMNDLDELVARADALANRTESRLQGISTPPAPAIAKEATKLSVSLPPLYEALRSKMLQISRSLNNIDDTLDRVQL
jgi:hypothetical protein